VRVSDNLLADLLSHHAVCIERRIPMATSPMIPNVDVAVTLIVHGSHILAVYNPNWDQFTLPMTKRRHWQDPNVPASKRDEQWVDAAARAAAQWLGRTCFPEPEFLYDLAGFEQSDRDGIWKRYDFRVFRVRIEQREGIRSGEISEWLSAEDFLDARRVPIAESARSIIARLRT